ncbi:hypothetical protein N7520_005721 [Penicillium odoratum]|uniref:uncharacterized protein n=1 Tax=Penicillium odoratum TaxID=1167516 RepID=UPI0025465F6F|nr:uncharacterized protein N7520_005721 [Penicillium odoratum]KAJ5758565.1 hypothetical protein N7520_005721 [Penicillium odoratum]
MLASLQNTIQAARGLNVTVLKPPVQEPELQGKWIIISGSNNGVGLEAAKSFAKWGANLILACRDPPDWELHPTAALEECKHLAEAQGHISTIEWWELDMADLTSVEAFCQRWLESDRPLDILCNNAGLPSTAKSDMTKDGFQKVHQVNFLSHVLITLRIIPSLARSVEPRIVCTTSCVHHLGVLDLDHFNGGPDMKGNDYQNNKLYIQMWAVELQSRCLRHPDYSHIIINGVHPGFVASGIWETSKNGNLIDRVFAFFPRFFGITPQQGSLAITHAATSPLVGRGGMYFNRIWEAPAQSYCHDSDVRLKLWIKVDEELQLQGKGLLALLGL